MVTKLVKLSVYFLVSKYIILKLVIMLQRKTFLQNAHGSFPTIILNQKFWSHYWHAKSAHCACVKSDSRKILCHFE